MDTVALVLTMYKCRQNAPVPSFAMLNAQIFSVISILT